MRNKASIDDMQMTFIVFDCLVCQHVFGANGLLNCFIKQSSEIILFNLLSFFYRKGRQNCKRMGQIFWEEVQALVEPPEMGDPQVFLIIPTHFRKQCARVMHFLNSSFDDIKT